MDSFLITQYTMLHIPRTLSDDKNSVLHTMGPYLSKMLLHPTKPLQTGTIWRPRPESYPRSIAALSADNLLVRRMVITLEAQRLRGSLICNRY